MNAKRLKLSGILFLIAGLAFIASGLVSKLGTNTIIGSAFIVIGATLVARSRKIPAA